MASWRRRVERLREENRALHDERHLDRQQIESLEAVQDRLNESLESVDRELEEIWQEREAFGERVLELESHNQDLLSTREQLLRERSILTSDLEQVRDLLRSLRQSLGEDGQLRIEQAETLHELEREVRQLRGEKFALLQRMKALEAILPPEAALSWQQKDGAFVPLDDPNLHLFYVQDAEGLVVEARAFLTHRMTDLLRGRAKWDLPDVLICLTIFVLMAALLWFLWTPMRWIRRRRLVRRLEASEREIHQLEVASVRTARGGLRAPAWWSAERAASTEDSRKEVGVQPEPSREETLQQGAAPVDAGVAMDVTDRAEDAIQEEATEEEGGTANEEKSTGRSAAEESVLDVADERGVEEVIRPAEDAAEEPQPEHAETPRDKPVSEEVEVVASSVAGESETRRGAVPGRHSTPDSELQHPSSSAVSDVTSVQVERASSSKTTSSAGQDLDSPSSPGSLDSSVLSCETEVLSAIEPLEGLESALVASSMTQVMENLPELESLNSQSSSRAKLARVVDGAMDHGGQSANGAHETGADVEGSVTEYLGSAVDIDIAEDHKFPAVGRSTVTERDSVETAEAPTREEKPAPRAPRPVTSADSASDRAPGKASGLLADLKDLIGTQFERR